MQMKPQTIEYYESQLENQNEKIRKLQSKILLLTELIDFDKLDDLQLSAFSIASKDKLKIIK
jgi:glycosyltransferase A (GT-A) superfamily protein (DUF2064 family)